MLGKVQCITHDSSEWVSEGTLKKQAYKSNGIVAAPLHSLAAEINVFRYSLLEYKEKIVDFYKEQMMGKHLHHFIVFSCVCIRMVNYDCIHMY